MKLLLDTHILLWVMRDARELSAAARGCIERADEVYVSSVSLWESAIKAATGKLPLAPAALEAGALRAGFIPLPVTWAHALAVDALPMLHRDPFDRMLVAQAVSEPLQLLTHDATLKRYSPLVTVV
ncbi:MAG: type II toxin-antitoxin system VapC family toxin [Rubrivivax sp.]|nr:type II toxin-antitoxin system VapC family toxin [Rubrivivax sp.]